MKKLLSYLMVFVMVFAISTTVTMKVKSQLLDSSQTAVVAEASGETSLLSGVMNSIERNPKLNVGGRIGLALDEQEIDINLNADINFVELTNPEVSGSVQIKHDDKQLDLFLTYAGGTIYIAYGNVKVKASIADINNSVTSISGLFSDLGIAVSGESASAIDGLSASFANISVDTLLDALSNPKKTAFEDYDQYELSLPGICDVVLICDQKFNISAVSIKNFVLIENCDVTADLFVAQDENIVIEEPQAEHYFDIASAIDSVGTLFTEDYLNLNAWVSLYKNKRLAEFAKLSANLDMKDGNYAVSGKLSGAIDAIIDAKYLQDELFLKFNDINISAKKSTIEMLIGLIQQNFANFNFELPQIDVQNLVAWIKNNYKNLLDNAVISDTKIKLNLDLSNFVEGLDELEVLINFRNGKIDSVSIDGLEYQNYMLRFTVYVGYPENMTFAVNKQEYFEVETACALVDTIKNLGKFEISSNISALVGGQNYNVSINSLGDAQNHNYQLSLSGLYGIDIDLAYLNSAMYEYPIYMRVGDIYLSVPKNYIAGLAENKVEEIISSISMPQTDDLIAKGKELLGKYWIGDILKLSTIKLNKDTLEISANLTALVHKTCEFNLSLKLSGTMLDVQSFELVYDQTQISGNFYFSTTEKQVSVANKTKYLDIKWLVNNLQSYLSSPDLLLGAKLDVQNGDGTLVDFDGTIGAKLAEGKFEFVGAIKNLLGKYNFADDVRLVYDGERIYFEYGAQKFDISEAKVIGLLEEFGYDISAYVQQAKDAISYVSSINIYDLAQQAINNFDISSVNISEISVSQQQISSIVDLIKSVKINSSQIKFAGSVLGYAIDADLRLYANKLVCELAFAGGDLSVAGNITLSKAQANYDTSADSINLDAVADVASRIAQIASSKAFEGTINLSFGEEEYKNITATYKLAVDVQTKSVVGVLSATYFGKEIKIRIENTKLYIDIAGVHVSCTIDELMSVLRDELVSDYVPEAVQSFDINSVKVENIITKAIDLLAQTKIIYSLTEADGTIAINLLDKFDLAISNITNSSLGINFETSGISANISLCAREELELEEVQEDAYTSLAYIFDMAKRAYNYICAKQYFANFVASIGISSQNTAINVSGYVGYNGGLTLEASTTLFGKTICVKIAERVVYVDIDGLKLKLGFADAYALLAKATEVFELNIDARILDLAQKILTQEELDFAELATSAQGLLSSDFDIGALVQNIDFAFDSNILSLAIYDAEIAVQFDQNSNLAGATIAYQANEFALDAQVDLTSKQQVEIAGEYADLADAKNLLETIKLFMVDLQYSASVVLSVGEQTFEASAQLKIENKRIFLQVATDVFGKEVLATFVYDADIAEYVLYLSVAGINIKATLDDIPAVIDWINETFDKDIQIDIEFIKELLNTLDFTMLLGRISLADISLAIADSTLTIGYKNIGATLEMSDDISGNIAVDGEQLCTLALAQQSVEFEELQSQYLEFADVFEIVKNIYAYVTSKAYYANIDLSFELTTTKDNEQQTTTISIEDAYIGYDADGLVLNASLELFGKTLSVTIVEKVVYINFDGFKAKLSLADAYALLTEVVDVFEINLDQNIIDLIEYVLIGDQIEFSTLLEKAKALSSEPIDIEQLVSEATISLRLEQLALEILGADITANFENSNLASIILAYSKQTDDKQFAVDATITLAQKQQVEIAGTYANLADAKNLLSTIKEFADAKQIVGEININFDKIDVTGTYKVNFEDGFAMSLEFSVYGLDVVVILKNNTLYVQLEGIKVKASLDNLDDILAWASETFNKDIDFDTSMLTSGDAQIADILDMIDFANLELSISNNRLVVGLGEFAIDLTFASGINGTITYQKQAGEGEEQRKPLVITIGASTGSAVIEVADHEYSSYTIITDLIDSVMEIVNNKRVSITLPSFKVYDGTSVHYTASGSLQLDLSDENNKLFHAQVIVKDLSKDKTYDVRLSYRNNYWWIYFNNLKVKMHKNDVKELVAIICKVMDLDTTLIPGLAEVSANLDDINFESLSAILPDMSGFDPLSILGYIKSLTLENGQLICNVDASLVTDNPDATDMCVVVDSSSGRLNAIYGQNIYTGVTNAEHFDVELLVDASFGGVGSPASGSYIDLSGSNELIKALFNTAELDYFNVSGNISASLGSWNLVDIPIVLQVKVGENRKPTIYAKLDLSVLTDSIISSVANGIVFESNYKNNHIVQIYYKDDYVYFYSTGNSSWSLFGGTTYAAKMVKVHLDSLLEDPMYYLSFALSFSDTIQNEIDSSLESTAGYEPDLGKIIKSYTVTGSRNFQVVLDMEEISGNNKLSDTTINIGVINNSSTGGKNYLGTAGFDFQLSVGLTIHLSSTDLKLINIGKTIDFTAIDNFINSYAYGEGREMESTNGGSSYSQTGGKQYSVSFNSNGGASVATKTGYAGTTFALPTLANKIVNGDGTKEVYAFAGWWEDSTLLKTPYTKGVIGHKNITIYAKWELIESYRTINFYLDGSKVSSVLALVGSNISYSGLQLERIVENGGYKYYQSFDKYTDANGNEISVVGNVSQNVYINYINTNVLKAYTLSFDTGVATAVASISVYETESYAGLLPAYTTLDVNIGDIKYTYAFGGWYNESNYQTTANGTMPSANKTIYAKWTLTHTYTTTYYYLDGNQISVVQALASTSLLTPAELGLPNARTTYSDGNSIKYEQSAPHIVDANGNAISVYGQTSQIVYVEYNTDQIKYLHVVSYDTGVQNDAIANANVYSTESYAIPPRDENIDIYDAGADITRTYRFDGWFLDTEYTLVPDGIMPNNNITLYANWTLVREYAVRTLTIYDNGVQAYSKLIEVGAEIDLSDSGLKIDANTQWYTTGEYTTQISLPSVMPLENKTLHIRNKYTFAVTTHTKSGNNYVETTTSTSVYQGDAIAYSATSFETIYTTNNSISNGQKDTYTSTGFKEGNVAFSATTMPNRDVAIVEQYSKTTQYLVQFITNTTYTMTHKYIGVTYTVSLQNAKNTPSDAYVTAGTTITVSNYYNNGTPTRKGTYKLKIVGTQKTVNYTIASWSKTDSGSGGSATWKITEATKLYAVWKES